MSSPWPNNNNPRRRVGSEDGEIDEEEGEIARPNAWRNNNRQHSGPPAVVQPPPPPPPPPPGPPPHQRSGSFRGRPTDPRFRRPSLEAPARMGSYSSLADNNSTSQPPPFRDSSFRRESFRGTTEPGFRQDSFRDPRGPPGEPFRGPPGDPQAPFRGVEQPPFRGPDQPPFRGPPGDQQPPFRGAPGDQQPPFRGPSGDQQPPFRGPPGEPQPPFRGAPGDQQPPFRGPSGDQPPYGGPPGGDQFRGDHQPPFRGPPGDQSPFRGPPGDQQPPFRGPPGDQPPFRPSGDQPPYGGPTGGDQFRGDHQPPFRGPPGDQPPFRGPDQQPYRGDPSFRGGPPGDQPPFRGGPPSDQGLFRATSTDGPYPDTGPRSNEPPFRGPDYREPSFRGGPSPIEPPFTEGYRGNEPPFGEGFRGGPPPNEPPFRGPPPPSGPNEPPFRGGPNEPPFRGGPSEPPFRPQNEPPFRGPPADQPPIYRSTSTSEPPLRGVEPPFRSESGGFRSESTGFRSNEPPFRTNVAERGGRGSPRSSGRQLARTDSGRRENWSSPQSSPAARKATVEPAVVVPEVPVAETPKKEVKVLTTEALEEAVRQRAEGVLKTIAELVPPSKPLSEGQPNDLPTKTVILKAVALVDAKIKKAQKETDDVQLEVDESLRMEAEAAEQAKERAIIEAQQRKEAEQKKREEKELSDMSAKQELLERIFASRETELNAEGERDAMELERELGRARTDVDEGLEKDIQAQMETATVAFERDLGEVRNDLEEAEIAAEETLSMITTGEGSGQPSATGPTSHFPDPVEVVKRIYTENRERAAQAHAEFFADFPISKKDEDDPNSLGSLRDPKENRTTAEWATMSRDVTGFSNALYTDPWEAPYFEANQSDHEEIAPLVTEYVRHINEMLEADWRDLAEEYDYRKKLYKEQRKKTEGSNKGRQRQASLSSSVRHSIFGAKPTAKPSLEPTSGVRNSNNPYRRARRGNEVRSEYEQEQIIQEIASNEAFEKRITFGRCELPRQVGPLENKLTVRFFNTFSAQKVDLEEQERELARTKLWTDMEKCIFLDRFLQHPKDFRKIASFLRNKSTTDCIAFYYDSKKTVPYKEALREHVMRRKRRGDYHVWNATIDAAIAVGAVVEAGPSEEKPLVFLLPDDDSTFFTNDLHPLRREMFSAIAADETMGPEVDMACDDEVDSRGRKRKYTSMFDVNPEARKYLKTTVESFREPPELHASESMQEDMSEAAASSSKDTTPLRKAPQKWTTDEKQIFLETLEKYGRNWTKLAEAVGTKNISQIKNFYYDSKKEKGKNRSEKRSNRMARVRPLEQNEASLDVEMKDAEPQAPEPDEPVASRAPSGTASYTSTASDIDRVRSGSNTPDHMQQDLWANQPAQAHQQQLYAQSHLDEVAAHRQLQEAAQRQHLLSSLLPWSQSHSQPTHNSLQDWSEAQQIQQLLQLHRQQQQSQSAFAGLGGGHLSGMSGLSGLNASALSSLGLQQQQHEEETQLAALQRLLGYNNGRDLDRLAALRGNYSEDAATLEAIARAYGNNFPGPGSDAGNSR